MRKDFKFAGIPLILSINLLNNAPTGVFEGGCDSLSELRIPKSDVKFELVEVEPFSDI